MPKSNLNLKPSQLKFIDIYTSLEFLVILVAGSVNTGKSYVVALTKVGVCNDFPNSRIGVFRKNLTTARKTIIPTYREVLNGFGIKYRELGGSEPKFLLDNGSTVEFFEMDKSKDPDWYKLKGLQLTGAHVDEVDEILEDGINVLITRVGRWSGSDAPAIVAMTCNPNNTWVRTRFYDPFRNGTLKEPFAMVLSGKEEIPLEYLQMLQETLPPAEYNRYVENNWDYAEDENQLIPYELYRRSIWEPDDSTPNRMGVDVARLGKDLTVQALLRDGKLLGFRESKKLEEAQTAELVKNTMLEYGIDDKNVSIDIIGPGGGVASILKTYHKIYVNEFNGGGSPTRQAEPLQFRNLRAQYFWKLRTEMEAGNVNLIEHETLKKELLNLRYFVKDRYIQIENKEDMKKRLGFSPDHADAISMALFNESARSAILDYYKNESTPQPPSENLIEFIKSSGGARLY